MERSTSNILSCFLALIAIWCFLFLPVVDFGWLGTFSGLDALQKKKVDFVYWLFLIAPIVSQALIWRVKARQHRLLLSCLMLLPALIYFFEMLSDCDWHFDMAKGLFGSGFWVYTLISFAIIFVSVKDDDEHNPVNNVEQPRPKLAIHLDDVRRTYTVSRLKEVIDNAQQYDSTLVERCKEELLIRQEAVSVKAQVAEFSDEKICEVLQNSENHSFAIVYCCQLEQVLRKKAREEQERVENQKRMEEERARQEQEDAERKERIEQWWKKYKWHVAGSVAIMCVVLFVVYLFSDGRYYKKGMAAYEKEDYDTAIEYLSGVSDKYEDYPTANWLLFCSCLVKNDSASAAQYLLNAVANGDWDKQPEASRKYCEYVVSGQFAPYIKSNFDDYVKCADLMSMAYLDEDAEKIRVGAGELYHSVYKEKEAVRIFSCLASVNDNSYAAKVANGYLGVYYLYGLGGMERNLNEAQKYLKCAADNNSLFEKCRTITALASMTTPNYSIIRELSSSLSPSTPSKTIQNVLEKLLAAEKKHRSQWVGHDSEWNNYSFDKGNGHYEGEYESYGYLDGGAAKGWGVFVHRGDNKGDKYRTITMGKFVPKGKSCLLQGDGIYLYYELQSGEFRVDIGKFDHDNLQTGETWSSGSNEDIKKIHELNTFHCVPQPKKVLVGQRWL